MPFLENPVLVVNAQCPLAVPTPACEEVSTAIVFFGEDIFLTHKPVSVYFWVMYRSELLSLPH